MPLTWSFCSTLSNELRTRRRTEVNFNEWWYTVRENGLLTWELNMSSIRIFFAMQHRKCGKYFIWKNSSNFNLVFFSMYKRVWFIFIFQTIFLLHTNGLHAYLALCFSMRNAWTWPHTELNVCFLIRNLGFLKFSKWKTHNNDIQSKIVCESQWLNFIWLSKYSIVSE